MAICERSLTGLRVLVTRPHQQAKSLQCLLEERGAQVILLPTIEIKPIALGADAQALVQHIHRFDLLIFVSANAVDAFVAQKIQLAQVGVGAIGAATASRLMQAGVPVTLLPADGRYHSESLLAMPELQNLQGKSILILRGVGGRPLLGDELQARGASVAYLELYQRCPVSIDPSKLVEISRQPVDIITVYSGEALENLVSMLRGHLATLLQTPLLVVSESMQSLGKKLGFTQEILLADQVSDEAVVDCIVGWANRKSANRKVDIY